MIKTVTKIETPKTVEEFRVNLKKYYVCIGDNLNVSCSPPQMIPIKEISRFGDIYKITKTGFSGDGTSPSITPKVIMKKDLTEFMSETGQFISIDGYFENSENYEIVENQSEFMKGDPKWVSLDNQLYRDFFMMTLGKYSGYEYWD